MFVNSLCFSKVDRGVGLMSGRHAAVPVLDLMSDHFIFVYETESFLENQGLPECEEDCLFLPLGSSEPPVLDMTRRQTCRLDHNLRLRFTTNKGRGEYGDDFRMRTS